MVDTFAESRQSDVQSLAEEMEDEIEHDRSLTALLGSPEIMLFHRV